MSVRTLTPLLGDQVLPDPWVSAVVEPDDAGTDRVVLYMVGTSNLPMLDEQRRTEYPAWSTLPETQRAELADAFPALCPLYRSVDLGRTWEVTTISLFGSSGALGYGRVEVWAPEIHQVGRERPLYVCVYSTRRDGRPGDAERVVPIANKWVGKFDHTRHLVVGQMIAESITGPYTVSPEPLVDTFFGAIDPHLFENPISRERWLFWKEDLTAHGLPAQIYMQQVAVTATGLERVGEPRQILRADPTSWHGVTVEGMVTFHDPSLPPDWVYLLFSGNECFDDSYGTGCMKLNLSTGETELLPHPILCKDTECVRGHLVGIGHPSIIELPAGHEIVIEGRTVVRQLLFAHAWRVDDVYGVETDRRRPYVFGLVLDDGWPKLVPL